jgi:thiamine pyrophosphokinase
MHQKDPASGNPPEVFRLKAIVFANGQFAPPGDLAARIAAADLLVAADGGLSHFRTLDLLPDLLVGDLDSLPSEQAEALEEAGVEVRRHPPEKDQTDLELALLEAAQRGSDEAEVLGGLARRWDHSLANLLLPALPALSNLRITFLHGEQRIFLIRHSIEIEAPAGTRLSLIPIGGDAQGVRTEGLAYPLAGETLAFGSSRGVSNEIEGKAARVQLETGFLLCVISPNELD